MTITLSRNGLPPQGYHLQRDLGITLTVCFFQKHRPLITAVDLPGRFKWTETKQHENEWNKGRKATTNRNWSRLFFSRYKDYFHGLYNDYCSCTTFHFVKMRLRSRSIADPSSAQFNGRRSSKKGAPSVTRKRVNRWACFDQISWNKLNFECVIRIIVGLKQFC